MGGPCPYQSSKYLPPLRDFAGAATVADISDVTLTRRQVDPNLS